MTPVLFGPASPLNQPVGEYISNLIWGEPDGFEKFCTMGVFHNGGLVGGTVYHNWHPREGCIELSSASLDARWLTRGVIREMFHIAFNMLKARIAVLRVSEHNEDMRNIARRFGFRETVIPQLRGDNEAECVYTLTAADWAAHKMNKVR